MQFQLRTRLSNPRRRKPAAAGSAAATQFQLMTSTPRRRSAESASADSSVKQREGLQHSARPYRLNLEDGNVKAAIRLLMSADSPAEPSQKSLNALRDKHPPPSSDLTDLPTPQSDQCLSVNNSEVCKGILSFPGLIWGT